MIAVNTGWDSGLREPRTHKLETYGFYKLMEYIETVFDVQCHPRTMSAVTRFKQTLNSLGRSILHRDSIWT